MDRHVRFERRAGVRAVARDRRVAEEPAAERVVLAVQGRVEDVGDGGFERAARRRLRSRQPHARAPNEAAGMVSSDYFRAREGTSAR